MFRKFNTLPLILAVFFLILPGKAAADIPRNALVIGNSNYTRVTSLKNPINDANDMAAALEKKGFQVIKVLDANRSRMRAAIRKFEDRIRKGGVGLFFYAGHGVQVNGENYLVPVDANVQRQHEIDDEAVRASAVLGAMEEARNGLNIIILDACRDNPFRSFRSLNSGLAKMDAPTGSILIYATAPGDAASDGGGRNGLFTSYLLKHMDTPGLAIEPMLKRVRIDVMKASGKTQTPWESSSLTGDFYFAPKGSASAGPASPPAQTAPVPPASQPPRVASNSPQVATPSARSIHYAPQPNMEFP